MNFSGLKENRTIFELLFVGILLLAVCFCFTAGCIGDGDDTPLPPLPNDIRVTKTDGDGAARWVTVLDTSDYEGFEDVTETTDGRFAIVCIDYGLDYRVQKLAFVDGGGTVDSVAVFDNNSFNSWDSEATALSGGSVSVFDGECDFVVIDSDGVVVTETVLCDTDPPVWPYVAVSPSPGDRTLAGWGEYCALIDKTGEVVWQKAYGDPELASRHPVLGLRNGDAAVLFPENLNPELLRRVDVLHLLRLDGDGVILWDHAFPKEENEIWMSGADMSLEETDDGNLFLLTTAVKTESGIFGEHTSVVYTLRMVDGETGALISEKSDGGHGDGSVDIFDFSDDTLTLRRYNNDLKQISDDIRFEGEYDMQYDVIATSDGGYLIVSIL